MTYTRADGICFFPKICESERNPKQKEFNTVPAINCRCLWFSVVTLLALQFTNRIFRQTKRQIIIDVCEMGRPNSRKKNMERSGHIRTESRKNTVIENQDTEGPKKIELKHVLKSSRIKIRLIGLFKVIFGSEQS